MKKIKITPEERKSVERLLGIIFKDGGEFTKEKGIVKACELAGDVHRTISSRYDDAMYKLNKRWKNDLSFLEEI